MRDLAVFTVALAIAGCAPRVQLPPAALVPDREVVLNAHALTLHFANPHARADLPLLVFATGDGGWHRKDLDAWRHLASWGYPTAGFDARDYVTHLGPTDTTTPARLASDYARIIAVARASLALAAARPVVLVGVSRGAGLAVVAAGDRSLRAELSGVLAVALTREEEYVRAPEMVQLYPYLPQLGSLPLAVVQSTSDEYLPAPQARALFGPDSAHRHRTSIEAGDHSFAHARDALYRAMEGSLEWIDGQINGRPSARR